MITFKKEEFFAHPAADQPGDSSLANRLFMIAGTIGIAIKNGYSFGFPEWKNSQFFVNPLPLVEEKEYQSFNIPWGFNGFYVPDDVSIYGYLQTYKYFNHCLDLIRYYLIPKKLTEPLKDVIIIHYRAYYELLYDSLFAQLNHDYFIRALQEFPTKKVIVITDNIPRAKDVIKEDFEYINNNSITDFYLLTQSDYIIMSNSSFSAMGAILSKAKKIVAPNNWFASGHSESAEDIYCENWIRL
jgi:hypothetical protein